MSLLKSAATVGGFTLISRLLGFLRDQLIAFTLGTGPIAEAFFVAQRFPNLFRALFAEGAGYHEALKGLAVSLKKLNAGFKELGLPLDVADQAGRSGCEWAGSDSTSVRTNSP